MKEKAFTLIEVMVVMAIISILAGMMMPPVWKFWESEQITTTKQRLEDLRLAMVGNKNDHQTGIRTKFGFVGDNGELPFCNHSTSASSYSLSILVTPPNPFCAYPHWNGPYMSGYEPVAAFKDAWGVDFSYQLCKSDDDRYLSGALRSPGPDGKFDIAYDKCATERSNTFCVGDDICVAIDRLQVAPTYRIQGNFLFRNVTTSGVYSSRFSVTYRDPNAGGGEQTVDSACKSKSDSAFPNFTTVMTKDSTARFLPIGKATFVSKYYNNSNCTDPPTSTSEFEDYF